jgi:hypothetical protein
VTQVANGKAPYVRTSIGLARAGERLLAEALLLVANRHERDSEVRDMCKQLADDVVGHRPVLDSLSQRYGEETVEDPERVRSALFHGIRIGGIGKLRDLQDLALLGQNVRLAWVSLVPAAGSLHDREMELSCTHALSDINRQIKWLQTQIEQTARQALTVEPDTGSALQASLPKTPTPAAMPDILWTPLTGGLLVMFVGLVSWALGQPWLVPSLGPTAYLQAEIPAHPSAKLFHVVVGHAIGLAAGFFAVAVFYAWQDPVLLTDHQLTLARVMAAALALLLTLLGCLAVKASHPPAGATALLVALGSIATGAAALSVAVGVVLLGLSGEYLRWLRLKGALPRSV